MINHMEQNNTPKQTTEFKLTGLSRPKSMTCHTDKEDIFWPKVMMPQDRFDALWDYMDGDTYTNMIAEVQHDGLYEDGTPINPVVINAYHKI